VLQFLDKLPAVQCQAFFVIGFLAPNAQGRFMVNIRISAFDLVSAFQGLDDVAGT
jgi:hypothetical protein